MERISAFLLGAVAYAADGVIPCGQSVRGANGSVTVPNPCDYNDFLLLVANIFNYLTMIVVPIATAVIVYGGIKMVTAGSNDSKRSQAKGIIGKAVWGLVITLAAYLIVKTIFSALVEDPAAFPLLF